MSADRKSRIGLRVVALGYLAVLLLVPVGLVFYRTFEKGIGAFWESITTPAAIHALFLTLEVAPSRCPLNAAFGIVAALALVRGRFPGKPAARRADRPAVRGLADRDRPVAAAALRPHGLVRPVARRPRDPDHLLGPRDRPRHALRHAAVRGARGRARAAGDRRRAGAGGGHARRRRRGQTFWRVTLPAIRWGLAYGIVLSTARAIGEFGAVSVVSGKISGETETLTLLVEKRFQNFDLAGAYAASALLAHDRLDHPVRHEPHRRPEKRIMIAVESVSKNFGDFTALDDVSFEAPDGKLTALLGPSGSGKSTLLRVIAGLEVPDGGTIVVSGTDATRLPPQKRGIGFVFQHYAAFKHMTLHDNVAFGLKIRKKPKAEIKAKVDELLHLVGLDGFHDRYPAQLSGGQRQRMALARALAVEPSVLLLDEPFGALDANVRADLRAWLRRLHEQVPVTTVLVTHDQEEAMELADLIVLLKDGKIAQAGAPRELYEQPADAFVMGFLGPVSKVRGELVRPHDVVLSHRPEEGWEEAMVQRVVHLGFEVRVELVRNDGEEISAQLTRGEAEALEPEAGSILWLRPPAGKVSA